MRCLMLLRHAKSAPADATTRDHDRPLDARGRGDAPKIGAYMVRHALVPDQVLVSTAKRARETWALAATAFATPPPVIYEPRLYEAEPGGLFQIIKETPETAGALLLVGHNPGLHKLAMLLIASGDTDARERLSREFPTTGLAVIDFAFDDWKKLHPQAGRLDRFVSPRSLMAATD
jgi:phosphohistidine phosphatase